MNNTATAICKENVLVEKSKYGFLRMEKEELAEILAVLSVKLLDSGISYGYSKEEYVEEIRAKCVENPIRDTFYINFSQHDNELRREVYKKFMKNALEVSK